MSEKNETIDIDATAKEIARELVKEFKTSGVSATKTNGSDDCSPSGVRYACEEEKECLKNFTCHPAREFECSKKFTG